MLGNRIDDMKEEMDHIDGTPNHSLPNNHVDQTEPAFSDEEVEPSCGGTKHVGDDDDDDDIPLGMKKKTTKVIVTLILFCQGFNYYFLY